MLWARLLPCFAAAFLPSALRSRAFPSVPGWWVRRRSSRFLAIALRWRTFRSRALRLGGFRSGVVLAVTLLSALFPVAVLLPDVLLSRVLPSAVLLPIGPTAADAETGAAGAAAARVRTAAAVTVAGADGRPVEIRDTSRIVSLSGAVTEIVFALGAGDRVVGVDTTSSYPEAARRLPTVGYQRALSAEGVLSLRPTLVLATMDAGPPAAIAQLRASGVALLLVPAEPTIDGVRAKVRAVAQALGLAERGEALVRIIEADLARAAALVERARGRPQVLFLLGRLEATPQAAGTGTAADAMIRLAGGANAVTGYAGYRPLTPEAAVAAAPDVLLVTEAGLEGAGGIEGLLALPGLALTPAGRARRVVAMDALYLLGFGPRVGQAALDLARRLHPELQSGRR